MPGFRGAEGKEKGKGVIVRWGLEEAQSKSAGRRTGTGYEVWYARDEGARDLKVLYPLLGVLYESGAYVSTVAALTTGGLKGVRKDWGRREPARDRPVEWVRQPTRPNSPL